jgi:UDP-N-acetylmuramyl pentapeptide synthase
VAQRAQAASPQRRVRVGASHAAIAEQLRVGLAAGDWVLLKGSRSMRMERIAESLGARDGKE